MSTHMSLTHKHRPLEMKGCFEVEGLRSDAVRIERYLKRHKSRWFLEGIVQSGDISEIIIVALKGK